MAAQPGVSAVTIARAAVIGNASAKVSSTSCSGLRTEDCVAELAMVSAWLMGRRTLYTGGLDRRSYGLGGRERPLHRVLIYTPGDRVPFPGRVGCNPSASIPSVGLHPSRPG